MEFLVLEVDGARFGVPTRYVREVLRAVSLGRSPTRFPNMAGMLNYRGEVLGVFELACLHGQVHREIIPQDHLIILQHDQVSFGLRVDRAVEIMSWDEDDQVTSDTEQTQQENAIAHPHLGVVHLLDPAALWEEMHYQRRDTTAPQEPKQEVEAS